MGALKGFQKKFLKGLAHQLKPVVFIGQKGLSNSLIGSIHDALDTHELIKVKIRLGDRSQRQQVIASICEQTSCEEVQAIGQIAVFYRKVTSPTINLP